MRGFSLRLLGGFTLSDPHGSEVAVTSRKQRALLCYLAASADRPVAREELADLLWGERYEAQSRQSLRQSLHGLRKLFAGQPEPVLRLEGRRVALDPAGLRIDTTAFLRAARSGWPEEAAALYRGELLAGTLVRAERFEEWLRQQRTRLREIACEVWQALVVEQLACQQSSRALESAIRLVALDPLRESSRRP